MHLYLYSGLGGKEDNKKLSQSTREKSTFLLLEFTDFELVIHCESEKQPEKNKSTIACCYYDSAFRLIKRLTLHMNSSAVNTARNLKADRVAFRELPLPKLSE